jgi:hypothetical protein
MVSHINKISLRQLKRTKVKTALNSKGDRFSITQNKKV